MRAFARPPRALRGVPAVEPRVCARASDCVDVEVRVPDVEIAHRRELAHRVAVGARRSRARRRAAACRVNPRSRPAISMLAASRFTSHSHGPGSVSSKSLTSNTSRRSGVPKTPKFERCASPQSCTSKSRARRRREVGGHDQRRAAVERERRDRACGRSGSARAPGRGSPPAARAGRSGPAASPTARTPRGSCAEPPRVRPCLVPDARRVRDAGRRPLSSPFQLAVNQIVMPPFGGSDRRRPSGPIRVPGTVRRPDSEGESIAE